MSIKKNAAANFAGQFYRAGIGILMLPVYLQFLGEESYGLVAFFSLLSSWLVLFTASIAPTLARQVAYARGQGKLGGSQFREMLRSLELIVVAIGVLLMLAGLISSGWLAMHWLTVETLELSSVSYCIALMGIMAGLTPALGMYSSGISGLERQVWLNGFSIAFATLRFGSIYVLLRWVSTDVVHYFQFQLALSLLELIVVARKFYACQPAGARSHDPGLRFSWHAIKSVLPFASGIAYTSVLWILMTQSDKLVLSHVLSLSEFGYFGIVVILANGVLLFSSPINRAVLPRMTMHHSRGNSAALVGLYRTSTQFLAVTVFSVGGVLATFSQPVIYALTGNQAASEWGAPVLTWFAMGNILLVIVGLQYSLQFAHGNVRLHVINTTINAIIQVPILVFVALDYGALAVAKTWFAIRLVAFFVWPAIVHRKFAPGLHWKWIKDDLLPPFLGLVVSLGLIEFALTHPSSIAMSDSRIHIVFALIGSGIAVLAICAFCAKEVRKQALRFIAGFGERFI